MQDLDNENTVPNKVPRPAEETRQTRVQPTEPVEATTPTKVPASTRPAPVAPVPPARPTPLDQTQVTAAATSLNKQRTLRWPWIVLGLLVVLAFVGVGSYMGYKAAIAMRKSKQEEAVVTKATEYYMLGLDAQKNKKYDLARRYFEAAIRVDPRFPGAGDRLAEVLMAQMATATPTIAPSPIPPTPTVPTPTPDTRSQDEKLAQAREQYNNKDWDNLFLTIDSLRTIDPSYHSVEVDGMLYMALRFRGIRKIYQEANLEGGTYDLDLAEKIAPLDSEALGARNAAYGYLDAISFWGVDWGKTIEKLEPVANAMPNLRDTSGMTAGQRYQEALAKEVEALVSEGKSCDATYYAQKAIDSGMKNLEPTATAVELACHPPTHTPTITPTFTASPSLAPVENTPVPPPAETPKPPEPSPTEGPSPTNTP